MEKIKVMTMTPELKARVDTACKEIIDLLMKRYGFSPEIAYGVLDHLIRSFPEGESRCEFREEEEVV